MLITYFACSVSVAHMQYHSTGSNCSVKADQLLSLSLYYISILSHLLVFNAAPQLKDLIFRA